jgi:hypothetical protein
MNQSVGSRETGSRADLAAVLEIFQQSPLFFGAEFPSRPDDVSGTNVIYNYSLFLVLEKLSLKLIM